MLESSHATCFYASIKGIDTERMIAALREAACTVTRRQTAGGQNYLEVVTDYVGKAMGLYIQLGGEQAGPRLFDAGMKCGRRLSEGADRLNQQCL